MTETATKHIVIIHGYLLRGTGSNIYTNNIAQACLRKGYAVTILCQDLKANVLPFVNEFYGPEHTAEDIKALPAPAAGTCRIVIPEIDGLLMVYNYDVYEGFEVKRIPDCSTDEIESHISKTGSYLNAVCCASKSKAPASMLLTNHAILSPVIAARALKGSNIPIVSKIHGSALSFSIIPNQWLVPYAVEGLKAAVKIITGTEYVTKQLRLALGDDAMNEIDATSKLDEIPPGMDEDLFKPMAMMDETSMESQFLRQNIKFVKAVAAHCLSNPKGRRSSDHVFDHESDDYADNLQQLCDTYNQRNTDADLVSRWPCILENEPTIVYIGALLHTKGIGEALLGFLGADGVLTKTPEARFIIVGFGRYREHLEQIIQSMVDDNVVKFKNTCKAGDFIDSCVPLDQWFRKITAAEAQRVTICGYLDHDELAELLPMATLSVVGSKQAEAFGMVGIEAMSAGVLPLMNNQTGLKFVLDAISEFDAKLAPMMTIHTVAGGQFGFVRGDVYVNNFVKMVNKNFARIQSMTLVEKESLENRMRRAAIDLFSWNAIVSRILQG